MVGDLMKGRNEDLSLQPVPEPARPPQHYRRWLILGAGGQLGSEWVEWMKRSGADYLGLTRSELDITDKTEVERALSDYDPDVVINCTAYTKVDHAEGEIESASSINVDAAGHLAALCAADDRMLVHYSTDYVFPGRMEDRVRHPAGYPVDFPPEPVNSYGRTKWLGEQAVRSAGGPHLILRVSWLCGKSGRNFVHTMLRLAEERDRLTVVNDQFGTPTFTAPVVHNTLVLLEQGARNTWHVTSRGETTWYHFASLIFSLAKKNVEVVPVPSSEFPTRAKRPAWSLLDTGSLSGLPGNRLLPWQQETEILLKSLKTG